MSLRIALIPAYQPDMRLTELVDRLRFFGFQPVVVDDGGGEAYAAVFQSLPEDVPVLTHEINRGKGAAIRTGLDYLRRKYADCRYTVVTLDADGQHLPADAVKVCDAAEENPEALVLGTRKFEGHVPPLSRFGNSATRLIFRLVTGTSIYDTQTGLRAFSNHFVNRMLSVEGDRYEYEMNVLMYFARAKYEIVQIPIQTVYLNGNTSSHFNRLRDSFRIYREIFRFAFRRHTDWETLT